MYIYMYIYTPSSPTTLASDSRNSDEIVWSFVHKPTVSGITRARAVKCCSL